MNSQTLNVFLTSYILSLGERTRVEKKGIKIGFDWIIYNLALAKDWVPVRLPFFREFDATSVKTKTEAEFGIDLSFVNNTKNELIIFVLKGKRLNNNNWIKFNFESDLRIAAAPDLSEKELSRIKSVRIILAYNKDEDQTGIRLFNYLAASYSGKIKDRIRRIFERWNITRITEEVKKHLISSDLLPQHLAGLLSYISSQVGDFDYGSNQWENQLIPNWKNFLRMVLRKPIDERKLRLIPVALLILYKHKKQKSSSIPGWIDLVEWAMLFIWDCYKDLKSKKLRNIIADIWMGIYISELERYFLEISRVFNTQHGLHGGQKGGNLIPMNDAHLAYWHIGRLGILTVAPQEFMDIKSEQSKNAISKLVSRSAAWIKTGLILNPSLLRPLIDLNHIELFLIWLMLWQSGQKNEVYYWLSELESRLLVRRAGKANFPFIESRNRLDLIAEFAATSERPPEFTDDSSYLLLMILELCFSLDNERRDELLDRFLRRIVKGVGDNGKAIADKEIDLVSWCPPDDWEQRILRESVTDGIAISTNNFEYSREDKTPVSERIRHFVEQYQKKFPHQIRGKIPRAVLVLACIKQRSPLPPAFWRDTIFQKK